MCVRCVEEASGLEATLIIADTPDASHRQALTESEFTDASSPAVVKIDGVMKALVDTSTTQIKQISSAAGVVASSLCVKDNSNVSRFIGALIEELAKLSASCDTMRGFRDLTAAMCGVFLHENSDYVKMIVGQEKWVDTLTLESITSIFAAAADQLKLALRGVPALQSYITYCAAKRKVKMGGEYESCDFEAHVPHAISTEEMEALVQSLLGGKGALHCEEAKWGPAREALIAGVVLETSRYGNFD